MMTTEMVGGGSVTAEIERLIRAALPDADVAAMGGGGHYSIRVRSAAFAGKSRVAQQRLVYSAITPLMTGETAPVHAVDALELSGF